MKQMIGFADETADDDIALECITTYNACTS
jgi:hypothetical protein